MAKEKDKDFKIVMGNPDWYIYRDKPSFKLFSAGVYLATAVAGLAFYGLAVPFVANLFPPTMVFMKWLTWIAAVGIPGLTILSAPQRVWRAFKARIGGWYRKLFKPSPRDQVKMNIEMLKEKVGFLEGIATQMGGLHQKWEQLLGKYSDQLDDHRATIENLKAAISRKEASKDPKIQLEVLKAKKELLLIYNKAETTHSFVQEIREKAQSIHVRYMQAEEVRDREHNELELLKGKYELLIAQSELGQEAEETQRKLTALSAGGIDMEYFREVSETSLIGETEHKLALLDITLNSINVTTNDLGFADMETQLNMGAARSSEYMDKN
jgi:hypothetical protein